jgi:polyisoprenoid-binding protein YceI
MDAAPMLRIDAGNARVSFSVRWFGVIIVRGTFPGLTGRIAIPGEGAEDASVDHRGRPPVGAHGYLAA